MQLEAGVSFRDRLHMSSALTPFWLFRGTQGHSKCMQEKHVGDWIVSDLENNYVNS